MAAWVALFGPSLVLLSAAIGGAASTEIHYWTHRVKDRPKAIRVMQEIGIIQSPAQHSQHHRPPSDRRYCIVTDWLNPLLDAARVWERLEAALTKMNLEPNRGTR